MALCKGKLEKTVRGRGQKGDPCNQNPRRGYEYCPGHMHLRPLSPEEEAEQALAIEVTNRIQAQLRERIPRGVAAIYLQGLRKRIPRSPELVDSLVKIARTPEEEANAQLSELVNWFEAQWKTTLEPFEEPDASDTEDVIPRGRTGPRVKAKAEEYFTYPTAQPVLNILMLIGAKRFSEMPNAPTIYAVNDLAQVRFECDPASGFTAERAIQKLAQCGPSVVQTFLAMAGLWMQKNNGKPYETYLTAGVTDLLRFMGRKEKDQGGYNTEVILPRGQDVFMLSNAWVPNAQITEHQLGNEQKIKRTLRMDRLVVVQSIQRQDVLDVEGISAGPSYIEFRYHLSEAMHEFLAGDHAKLASLSSRILQYHPIKQKYQVLLGLALAYYQRVNKKRRGAPLKIGLPALLNLACIEIPKRKHLEFMETVKRAVSMLNTDNVIPGVRIELGHPLIEQSIVHIPAKAITAQ